jgi:alpha-glucoside transport system permease protein
MSAITVEGGAIVAVKDETPTGTKIARRVSGRGGRIIVWLLAALWTIPTFGLLISSFRPETQIKTTGWWKAFSDPQFTLHNYSQVLDTTIGGFTISKYFWNSVAITIPGALIPITVAAFAAYAFSWMNFKGRDWMFVGVVALLVVPLQMCLIPLLSFFSNRHWYAPIHYLRDALGDELGGFPQVWLAHAIFAMPLTIFLLKNFIGSLPREVMEAARVDGATHMTIFRKIVLPLSVPALASIGIFQFLWVWNDLLVAKVFAGNARNQPLTKVMNDMVGSRGNDWQLLTAGAFVMMIVPLVVFLSLQRFFVRGLLAGSVKG